MAGLLHLHTDASVRGDRLPEGYIAKRRRVGHTFVAWAGWHECDLPDRPTFAGAAYVGEHGTQRAEFYAVHHGLSAALAYVSATPEAERPDRIVAHVDNDTVYRLMAGKGKASALRPHYEAASRLCAQLTEAGVRVEWRSVSERNKRHRIVDSMSKQAHTQVLTRVEWRPTDAPPPIPPVGDEDIPF